MHGGEADTAEGPGASQAVETRFADVGTGVRLAFDHAGAGGVPLLLIHGWPETRRIWLDCRHRTARSRC